MSSQPAITHVAGFSPLKAGLSAIPVTGNVSVIRPRARGFASPLDILLLQGPVGPFFTRLQQILENQGHRVRRICFNAGDRAAARPCDFEAFRGGREDWARRIDDLLRNDPPNCIILFGSERPMHKIARAAAERAEVRVISLEEGYLRPGYVTVEEGGNNASSPLAGRLPPPGFVPADVLAPQSYGSFWRMCGHGFGYYARRTLLQTGRERQMFHRPVSVAGELLGWTRNAWRRIFHAQRNLEAIQNLLEHHDGQYFLVPLQVAADGNMKDAALGWSTERLIRESIISFAKRSLPGQRLVFKVHPLERGHSTCGPLIRTLAGTMRVGDRVDVIDTGSLGLLARHAAGMITINSTSGLSAIHHGIGLMVIGRAVYAHPALATCADGNPDFDSFWTRRHVAPPALRQAYLAWLREKALCPGDFYSEEGIEVACRNLLDKLLPVRAVALRAASALPA